MSAINSINTGLSSNESSATTLAASVISVSSISSVTIKFDAVNKRIDTAVVVNSAGSPVSGALVSIKITGLSKTLTGSGVTGSDGQVMISLGSIKDKIGTPYQSCVNNVSLSGYSFDGNKPCSIKTL